MFVCVMFVSHFLSICCMSLFNKTKTPQLTQSLENIILRLSWYNRAELHSKLTQWEVSSNRFPDSSPSWAGVRRASRFHLRFCRWKQREKIQNEMRLNCHVKHHVTPKHILTGCVICVGRVVLEFKWILHGTFTFLVSRFLFLGRDWGCFGGELLDWGGFGRVGLTNSLLSFSGDVFL